MTKREMMSPFYVIIHPFKAFEEMKWERKGSFLQSVVILLLLYLTRIFTLQLNGFLFNGNRPEQINIITEFFQIAGLFAVWTVANWSFCTLTDGEGKFMEIWVSSAFALFPVVLASGTVTLLSNLFTLREGAFLSMISSLGFYWSALLMLLAMKAIHQYSLKKTIASVCITLVMMAFMLFLGILVFSMTQQFLIFINNIYSEIVYRL